MFRPVLVLVVLAVSGCVMPSSAPSGSGSSGPSTPPGSSSTPSTPADGPLPIGPYAYADGSCPNPVWKGLPELVMGPEYTCGRLTVPENRAKPDGKQISIPVARLKSSSPNPQPEPLLMLTGGPGGSGFLSAVTEYKDAELNRDRDVIFIDQRGTLHADPFLDCREIDIFTTEAVGLLTADPETEKQDLASVESCRKRWIDAGVDLATFDTAENAADLAALRLALEIDGWHVYGVSYGTDLTQQYLRNYPEGIRSAVLDSIVPPNMNLVKSFWSSAADGYQALAAACQTQPQCAEMIPDLEGTVSKVVNDLNAKPQTVDASVAGGKKVTAVVDGYRFANLVTARSLSKGGLDDIPAIIAAAAKGDVQPAANAIAAAGQPQPSLIVGFGLALGVFCRESVAYTTPEDVLAAAKEANPTFPEGVLRFTPQSPRLIADCGPWNAGKAPERSQLPARSDIPILILAGELDGVTAPANAEFATPTMPNAGVLSFPDSGHGVLDQSTCGPDTVTGFLNDPKKDYRPACLAGLRAPTFATTTG